MHIRGFLLAAVAMAAAAARAKDSCAQNLICTAWLAVAAQLSDGESVAAVRGPPSPTKPETVAALLKAGADPNARSRVGLGLLGSFTPLGNAVKNDYTEVVAALLRAGADPNARSTLTSVLDLVTDA